MSHKATHLLTGERAEKCAARYLQRRGWRICARNWIGGGGELDIVASRWRCLLIVEVRARHSAEAALHSVSQQKLRRIMRASRALITSRQLEKYRLRLDIIAVDRHLRITRKKDILMGLY